MVPIKIETISEFLARGGTITRLKPSKLRLAYSSHKSTPESYQRRLQKWRAAAAAAVAA